MLILCTDQAYLRFDPPNVTATPVRHVKEATRFRNAGEMLATVAAFARLHPDELVGSWYFLFYPYQSSDFPAPAEVR